jgi:2-amino-4-hydroxy-6-hydroxymethyldihydropteridine diphosphokinase
MEKVRLNRILLSLGSNLGDKIEQLKIAIEAIKACVGEVEFVSSFYESKPWGYQSENEFVNVCLTCFTNLTPFELLKILKEIEATMGRIKTTNGYQDRCIDIDIVFYNTEEILSEHLIIPHPHFKKREFVMNPLLEIVEKDDPFYHFINS